MYEDPDNIRSFWLRESLNNMVSGDYAQLLLNERIAYGRSFHID